MNDLTKVIKNLIANGVAVNSINKDTMVYLNGNDDTFREECRNFNIMDKTLYQWGLGRYHYIGKQDLPSIKDMIITEVEIEQCSANYNTSYRPTLYKLTLNDKYIRYAYGSGYYEEYIKYEVGSKIPTGTYLRWSPDSDTKIIVK